MDNAYTVVEANGKELTVYAVKPASEDTGPSHNESLLGKVSVRTMGSFNNPIKDLSVEVLDGTLKATFDLGSQGLFGFRLTVDTTMNWARKNWEHMSSRLISQPMLRVPIP